MCVPARPHSVARDRLRVLVVDDSDYCRRILQVMLKAWGMECVFAFNGEEGLAQASSMRPDLIITDLQMPVCDGFEFLANLSKLPADKQVPIIVLSGSLNELDTDKHETLKRADCVLEKPVHPTKLLECVTNIF